MVSGNMDTIIWNAPTASVRARWEDLGTIGHNNIANIGNGIMKCLNIPFANVPYRWAAPRPIPFSWSGTRDCTSFGPGCPQTAKPLFDVDGIPLFGRLGADSMPIRAEHEDEFACLNLNVFAPSRRDEAGLGSSMGKLPVLVWVHGGSYTVGSSSVDLYGKSVIDETSVHLEANLKYTRLYKPCEEVLRAGYASHSCHIQLQSRRSRISAL